MVGLGQAVLEPVLSENTIEPPDIITVVIISRIASFSIRMESQTMQGCEDV